jgi:hypothetical protein
MTVQQVVPPIFFFLVGFTLSYLAAKRIEDRVVGWLIIGISSAVVAAFAILFGTNLARVISDHNMLAVWVLTMFYMAMTDGFAAILAGIIAGTLLRMIRNPR